MPAPRQTTDRYNDEPRQPLHQSAGSGVPDAKPISIENMSMLDDALPNTPTAFRLQRDPPSMKKQLKRASRAGLGSSAESNAPQGSNESRKTNWHGIGQAQAPEGSAAAQQHEFARLSQPALASDLARPVQDQESWRSVQESWRSVFDWRVAPPSALGGKEGHKRKRGIEADQEILRSQKTCRRDSSVRQPGADAAPLSPTFRRGPKFDIAPRRRHSQQGQAARGNAGSKFAPLSSGSNFDHGHFAGDDSDEDEEPQAAQVIQQEAGAEIKTDTADESKKEAPMGIKKGTMDPRRASWVMPGTKKPHVGPRVIRGEKLPKGIAVQVVDCVSTRSHKGTENRHQSYETTEQETRDKRDAFIEIIQAYWPGVDRNSWIPMPLRPTSPDKLPINPQNWTTELLEWLAALAKITLGDLELAHKAMRRQTGGGAVGWQDLRYAYHHCAIARSSAQGLDNQANSAHPITPLLPEHVPNVESPAFSAHASVEDQDMKDVDETEALSVKQNAEGTPRVDACEQQAPAGQQRGDVAGSQAHINDEQTLPTVHGLPVQMSPSAQPLHQPLQFEQGEEGERRPRNLPGTSGGPADQQQNDCTPERELPSDSDTTQAVDDVSTMRFYGDFEFEYRSFGSDGEIRESTWGKGNGGALVKGGRIRTLGDSKRGNPGC